MHRTLKLILTVAVTGLTAFATPIAHAQDDRGDFRLGPCTIPGSDEQARCGSYTVFENRDRKAGRTIALNIMVLPARSENPRSDPVFFLAGGPGQAATRIARGQRNAWYRQQRDVVLVDQRGTGASNPLSCELPNGDENLQGYLEPIFTVEIFAPCLARLQRVADLTQYTTSIAMDDLDEVRAALGYDVINLVGGSYGTRAALVYMRRHPEHVRAAILNGVAPIAFRNPLYHAHEAQRALERTLDECSRNEPCRTAFPDLKRELTEVLLRLERQPAEVAIRHPGTGKAIRLRLTRYAFSESLRTTMYSLPGARDVPFLIHRAYEGDLATFAETAIASNRAIVDQLAFGMLLSVTCGEDVARIRDEEIPSLTAETFLGDTRVRGQMAVCAVWPRGAVPEDYGEPVRSSIPTLVLSGTLDPVTSPHWGEEAARHLSSSLHLVVPGAHGVGGPCVTSIASAFLDAASVDGLDTSCVAEVQLPPFRLPAEESL